MSNKKNALIKLVIVTIIFTALASQTFALKQAIFPDEKLLQPMPNQGDAHPNISGNVNNTTQAPFVTENGTEQPQDNTPSTTPTEKPNQKGFLGYVVWTIIILSIVTSIVLIFKKINQKTLN